MSAFSLLYFHICSLAHVADLMTNKANIFGSLVVSPSSQLWPPT